MTRRDLRWWRWRPRAARAAALAAVLLAPGAPALADGPAAGTAAGLAPSAPAAPPLAPVAPGPHGYFEYRLAAGATAVVRAVVERVPGRPTRYVAYAAAATTSPTSGVAYGQPAATQSGTASWLSPARVEVISSPRAARTLTFLLRVPRSARPGDYVAAIAAQPTARAVARADTGSRTRAGFIVTSRTVIGLVVHVAGPAHAAARFGRPGVALAAGREQVLTIPITDTGSALMKPYLAGALRPCDGRRGRLRITRRLDTFVPRTHIVYPDAITSGALGEGCYHVALALYRGQGGRRLAAYTGDIRVGESARVPPAAALGRPPVPTGGPSRLLVIAIAAVLAALLAAAGVLLLRARAERRRLLLRLADAGATRYEDDRAPR